MFCNTYQLIIKMSFTYVKSSSPGGYLKLLVFGVVDLGWVQLPNEVVLIGLVPVDLESFFFHSLHFSHRLRNTPPHFTEALSK